MLVWMSVAAVVVVIFLAWNLRRRFASSGIEAILTRRRATSRIVSDGEFVDGNRRMKVALALTSTDLFYENRSVAASLDLRWIREIEYDSALATGQEVADGKVLRIRSFSQVFEFVIPAGVIPRWHLMLPPRQQKDPPAPSELAAPLAVAT